jgi:spectinomycin phosphotransferase
LLERPEVSDEDLHHCLREMYRLEPGEITFLPLGADERSAAFRIVTQAGERVFAKVRRGGFAGVSLSLPKLLSERGVTAVLPPLETSSKELSAKLGPFEVALFRYIDGRNGYETHMSDDHWRQLGSALGRVHTVQMPHPIHSLIAVDDYGPRYRDTVRVYLSGVHAGRATDDLARSLSDFLSRRKEDIERLVRRSDRLGRRLHLLHPGRVLCHADMHAGNVLLSDNGVLYVVDWDEPALAPRERDIALVGGGFGTGGCPAEEEPARFFRGYGPVQVDRETVTYYRYERIVEDVAAFCAQIYRSNDHRGDRERALGFLTASFQPGGVLEMAIEADPLPRGEAGC